METKTKLDTIEDYDAATDRFQALCQKDASAWLQFSERDGLEQNVLKTAIRDFEARNSVLCSFPGPAIPLGEVEPGSLFLHGETLAMKTEYHSDSGWVDCYIVGAGCTFVAGCQTPEQYHSLLVTPLLTTIRL